MEMQKEIMELLLEMNGQIQAMNEKIDTMDKRLDEHEQLLKRIQKGTAMYAEELNAFRLETNKRFDKLEESSFKTEAHIDFLYKETLTHKKEISELKMK